MIGDMKVEIEGLKNQETSLGPFTTLHKIASVAGKDQSYMFSLIT